MKVVFDAEPLVAFSFDEPGADVVEDWLDQVYDGEIEGYISTINLAELRYIAIRKSSTSQADAQINELREMGVTEYNIDQLWTAASELKATYNPSIGDAYAIASAKALDTKTDQDVQLLVGPDDDYDPFEELEGYQPLIERFRDSPA